jgi:hypothetical protein
VRLLDLLTEERWVGRASLYIAHAWQGEVGGCLQAVIKHVREKLSPADPEAEDVGQSAGSQRLPTAKGAGGRPPVCYVWLDWVVMAQAPTAALPGGCNSCAPVHGGAMCWGPPPSAAGSVDVTSVRSVITACGTGVLLVLDRNMLALGRAWPLYEAWAADYFAPLVGDGGGDGDDAAAQAGGSGPPYPGAREGRSLSSGPTASAAATAGTVRRREASLMGDSVNVGGRSPPPPRVSASGIGVIGLGGGASAGAAAAAPVARGHRLRLELVPDISPGALLALRGRAGRLDMLRAECSRPEDKHRIAAEIKATSGIKRMQVGRHGRGRSLPHCIGPPWVPGATVLEEQPAAPLVTRQAQLTRPA